MQLKIRIVTKPGDTNVDRAQVRVCDSNGIFLDGQIVLEGETIEQDVTVAEGQKVEIYAMERPTVQDADQKAAVPMDLTPEDPLRTGPKPTPQKKVEDDKHAPSKTTGAHGEAKGETADFSKGISTSKESEGQDPMKRK